MKTALVADDDETVRALITEILASDGWAVIPAENGQEALELVRRKNPDLLILDQLMPRMAGGEVFHALRNEQYEIPVVFITAAQSITVPVNMLKSTKILKKPFSIDEFMRAVTQVVQSAAL